MTAYTADSFFNGRITVHQARQGYRFSIDAVLLAHQAAPRPDDRIADLGTGCGIIPLILAYRFPLVRIFSVEIQPELAEMARHNISVNGFGDRIQVVNGDLRRLSKDSLLAPVDLVISNPPFRKPQSGRVNPDPQRAMARHEIAGTLNDLLETGARLLRLGGRFNIIFPAARLAELLHSMRISGIEPKKLRMVHSRTESSAKLVLVEGQKGSRPGLTVDYPLIIYHTDGTYTDEVVKMFQP